MHPCMPDSMILSFSRYQVMPLPYSQITPEQWQHISDTLSPVFPKADYSKYKNFKDAQ